MSSTPPRPPPSLTSLPPRPMSRHTTLECSSSSSMEPLPRLVIDNTRETYSDEEITCAAEATTGQWVRSPRLSPAEPPKRTSKEDTRSTTDHRTDLQRSRSPVLAPRTSMEAHLSRSETLELVDPLTAQFRASSVTMDPAGAPIVSAFLDAGSCLVAGSSTGGVTRKAFPQGRVSFLRSSKGSGLRFLSRPSVGDGLPCTQTNHLAVVAERCIELYEAGPSGYALTHEVRGHSLRTTCCELMHNLLVSAGLDKVLRVHQLSSGDVREAVYRHSGFTTGRLVLVDGYSVFVGGHKNGDVTVWQVDPTPELLTRYEALHEDEVMSVAVIPVGELSCASHTDRKLISCGKDNTLACADIQGSRQTSTCHSLGHSVVATGCLEMMGPDVGVCMAKVSNDGFRDGFLVWRHTPAGVQIVRSMVSSHRSPMTCLSVSPDKQSIVTGHRDGTVLMWK